MNKVGPSGPTPPRPSNFAKMQAAMKREDETGRGLERGVCTAEELAAVEAACGFADIPLCVGA